MGALVSSVAHARKVADIEALRIARRYRQDDLLKGLPVPRLRFKSVNVSLPVIITELVPGRPASRNTPDEIARAAQQACAKTIDSARAQLDKLGKFRAISAKEDQDNAAFYRAILDEAGRDDFPRRLAVELQEALGHGFLSLDASEGQDTASDAAILDRVGDCTEEILRRLVRELVAQVSSTWEERLAAEQKREPNTAATKSRTQEMMKHEFVVRILDTIRHAAEEAAVSSTSEAPDFRVLVDTDRVKNAGGGDASITRINLVLLEEGLEWMSEQKPDGSTSEKLSPE